MMRDAQPVVKRNILFFLNVACLFLFCLRKYSHCLDLKCDLLILMLPYQQVLLLCYSGSAAGFGIFKSTQTADPGTEGLLHDQHDQSIVSDDGPLCPRCGRQ